LPIYKSERLFHFINGLVLTLLSLSMLAPMLHVLAVSLSSNEYVKLDQVFLWPKGFNTAVYQIILTQSHMWRAMAVTCYITIAGTLTYLFFTSTMAYALSRSMMPARKLILKLLIVTFVFSVPLIPKFLVIKNLGMINTYWALIIPGAVGAFGVIIMKTFFQGISAELFDAASIDGCSEFGIFARITIPLSLPVFATLGLFHAVGEWNSYFDALIYIRDKQMYPLQIILRGIVQDSQLSLEFDQSQILEHTVESMKSAVIIFATGPIILVYPFIQKYFVKGATVGSLKE
jgi:putative aldouronate transport system permease protein